MSTTPTIRPHRLSLSDVLSMVLARGSGNQDSVSLSRNAKGETQVEVVCRAREGETVEQVGARARREYNRNRRSYPYAALTATESGEGV